jgi:predicted MFS family arabinose efflux permease
MHVSIDHAESLPGEQPRYRWFVLALLTLVAALSNIDKNLLPAMAEPIKHEFQLTDAEFGLLAGLIYSTGFGLAGLPIGFVIDRINRSQFLSVLLAVWSVAATLCAFVGSYAQLAISRFVIGAAESGGQPISMALIADWFRIDRRGTAIGIWTFNRSISLLVSFAVGGYIAVHLGWRAAFLIAGLPGILLSVLMLSTLREPSRPRSAPVPQQRRAFWVDVLLEFRRTPPLLYLVVAVVLLAACQNGIIAFMSAFLTRAHGLPVDRAGLAVGVILGFGAGIGMPLGGVMTDLIGPRNPRRQYALVVALMLGSIPAALAGLLLPAVWMSILGLFLFELIACCAYTAILSTYLNTLPVTMRGALSALLTVLMIFVGVGLGPPIAGEISDLFGSAQLTEPLRWALSVMTISLVFGAALMTVCIFRHGARVSARGEPA